MPFVFFIAVLGSGCCFSTNRTQSVFNTSSPMYEQVHQICSETNKVSNYNRLSSRWLALLSSMNDEDCRKQRLLLTEETYQYHSCFYLSRFILQRLMMGRDIPQSLGTKALLEQNYFLFPLVFKSNAPKRLLYMGDSVSLGIYSMFRGILDARKLFAAHAPTTNCGDLWNEKCLKQLGSCQWDVIIFNNGYHFRGSSKDYIKGMANFIKKIQLHSPKAVLVFGTTTPPPNATEATTRLALPSVCKFANKFQSVQRIKDLNTVATSFSGIAISDRWGAVMRRNNLKNYQRPCDIHYNSKGYERLAQADYDAVTKYYKQIV